jgi:nucleoside 2-deoxyribosyltransferase
MTKSSSLRTRKLFLYLASPLFSSAERRFNEDVAKRLGRHFTVYLPQRDGGLFLDLIKQGLSVDEAAQQIFAIDIKAIEAADCVVAILDGRTIDEGVAFELGYACALRKVCYGLQTDPRRLLPIGNNPMITGALRKIASTLEELQAIAELVLLEQTREEHT